MLFEAWVARCSPNSDLGRAQKSLGTADLAILAWAVEVFFKSISVFNNKIQSPGEKLNLISF